MPKLTKSDRETLRQVLRHAERAQAYIMRPTIAICSNNEPMEKQYGSDLCGLSDAIRILGQYLATH